MMIITLAWWFIPLLVTILCIGYAITANDGGGYLSGIGNILLMVPALFISMVAWIVAAVLK